MGSAGLAVVNAVFDTNDEFDTNETRQEFAANMIENLGFLYEDTEAEVGYTFIYNSLNSDFYFSPSKVSSMGNL